MQQPTSSDTDTPAFPPFAGPRDPLLDRPHPDQLNHSRGQLSHGLPCHTLVNTLRPPPHDSDSHSTSTAFARHFPDSTDTLLPLYTQSKTLWNVSLSDPRHRYFRWWPPIVKQPTLIDHGQTQTRACVTFHTINVRGETLSNALKVYCEQFALPWIELNKLVTIHLCPADQLQGEGHLRRPGSINRPENAQDKIMFTALEPRLKEAFPKTVNMQAINYIL